MSHRFLLAAPVVFALFEGLAWHPLTAAGVAVSIAGNVLVLGDTARTRS